MKRRIGLGLVLAVALISVLAITAYAAEDDTAGGSAAASYGYLAGSSGARTGTHSLKRRRS